MQKSSNFFTPHFLRQYLNSIFCGIIIKKGVINLCQKEMLQTYYENLLPNLELPRIEVHKKGLLHQVIHIWIISKEENPKIYFQQRSKTKKTYPLGYDITATGHISSKEAPTTSAIREIYEETGIDIAPQELFFCGSKRYILKTEAINDNELANIYICRKTIDHFTPNDEVTAMISVSLSDFLEYCNIQKKLSAKKLSRKKEDISTTITLDKTALLRHIKEFSDFVKPYL